MSVDLIGAGEIVAGSCFIAIGIAFALQAVYSNFKGPTALRAGMAFMFIVGGLEEVFDALFTEGDGIEAIIVQAACTAAQIASGGLGVYLFIKAKMFSRDYATNA